MFVNWQEQFTNMLLEEKMNRFGGGKCSKGTVCKTVAERSMDTDKKVEYVREKYENGVGKIIKSDAGI